MKPITASIACSVPSAPAPVSLTDALRFWFKLGFISFGGPAGQIAIMHQELVQNRRWISESRFLHALNFCMLLPGPEAQQLTIYIGWLLHRTRGGIMAGTLFVIPSLLILILLSWIYIAFGNTVLVAGLFYGIKPAVTAVVIQAAFRIGSRTLRNGVLWAIAAASFVAIFFFNVPFPAIIGTAAVIGYLGGRAAPDKFRTDKSHGSTGQSFGPALIDNDTPTPEHARFRWSSIIRVVSAGVALWLIPMGMLMALFGWTGMLTQMGWFFTKAALLTFGGAYAVLPYVVQGAVYQYGWVSSTQMIDGLGLGETTPGPLIMIVAFVAFVGSYTHPAFSAHSIFLDATLAAALVTWFTFLPCFIFVFAGGPLVEAARGRLGFTAPLTAITAAVAGVILNLALYFGEHVFWPQGLHGQVDLISALIALCAAGALMYLERSVIQIIAVCALLGLIFKVFAT